MMISTRTFVAVLATAALTGSVFAASVVGKWNGKIQAQFPPLPANANPQMKQQYDMAQKMMSQMTIVMNFKANKTYTVSVMNAPGAKTPPKTETGKWSQSGNKVTVTDDKKQGPGPHQQVMTMSGDGRTMSLDLPAGQGVRGKVIFSKG